MFELRKSSDRGYADHGWLKARHTFSFANYYNPKQMGFRNLLVINQDIVAPSMGFPTHPHKDMEIITYVIHGSIRHKDSMGHDYVIKAGELQVMSAGTGVRHSEYNASEEQHLELMQIWILTDQENHTPSYAQHKFTREEKLNTLKLVTHSYDFKSDGTDLKSPALKIHQDVNIYASVLESNQTLDYTFNPNRYGWLQLISGELEVSLYAQGESKKSTVQLEHGDGLKIEAHLKIEIKALDEAEFIFFDLN